MNIRKTKGFICQKDKEINIENDQMELYGCYFLSLLSFPLHPLFVTKYNYDLVNEYRKLAIKKGYMQKDMYVLDPIRLYNIVAIEAKKTKAVSVSKEKPEYIKKDNQIEIQVWSYMPDAAHIPRQYHFVAIHKDGHGEVMYDPLVNSNCVQLGNVRSKRILILE